MVLQRPAVGDLLGAPRCEASAPVAARVAEARHMARARGVPCNAELSASQLETTSPLSSSASALIERRLRAGTLSARGLHRVWRVARTITDLGGGGHCVGEDSVAEALQLRSAREDLGGRP
ncbi:MAG: magnesium chelatase subunit ChlI family protein [Acidimicrobiales bacterium]